MTTLWTDKSNGMFLRLQLLRPCKYVSVVFRCPGSSICALGHSSVNATYNLKTETNPGHLLTLIHTVCHDQPLIHIIVTSGQIVYFQCSFWEDWILLVVCKILLWKSWNYISKDLFSCKLWMLRIKDYLMMHFETIAYIRFSMLFMLYDDMMMLLWQNKNESKDGRPVNTLGRWGGAGTRWARTGYKTRSGRGRASQELTHHLAVSILYNLFTPPPQFYYQEMFYLGSSHLVISFQLKYFPHMWPQSPEGARKPSPCPDISRRQKALTRTLGELRL